MNREIKFRGISLTSQDAHACTGLPKMVKGTLLQARYEDIDAAAIMYVGHNPTTGFNAIEVINVNPDTVGQYTGLKDKTRKEIYEGDIVKWGHIPGGEEYEIRIGEVKFNPDLCFDCKNISRPYVFDFGSFLYRDTEKYLEIIGNIHENPELL